MEAVAKKNRIYRYRYKGGTTRGSRDRFSWVIAKLGQIKLVRGYRYQGRYCISEAVLLKGVNGTARLSGLLWGYRGEGPRGTHELLKKLGVSDAQASRIAFNTYRNYPNIGTDWEIAFNAEISVNI